MSRQSRLLLALLVPGSLVLMGFSGPQQQSSQDFGTTSAFWLALLLVVILLGLLAWWAMRHETRPGLGAYLRPAAEAAHVAPAAAVEAEAEPTLPEPETPSAPAGPDDLTVIEGIGPKTASVLIEAGIGTYAQLAAADPAEIERVIRAAGLRLGDPATWPEQAALAARGDWDGLATLQASLKGGRRVD